MAFLPRIMESTTSLIRGYPEVLASIVCFVFLLHLKRRRGVVPTNWPFVGMLPALLSNLHRINDFSSDILGKTGCTFLLKGPWYSGMDLLITCDPANINHVFNSNFANYPKGDEFLEIFDILGCGIFNADYDSWKAQRRMTHGLMAEQKFRSYVVQSSRDKVMKGILPFLEYAAEEGMVVDLQDVFLRFTFDATSVLVMGVDPGCLSPGLPVVPFAKAMDDAEEVLLYRHILPRACWKIMRWLNVGEERRIAKAWKTIDKFVDKHISMKKEGMRNCDQSSPDLLTSYLDGKSVAEKSNGLDIKSDVFLRDTAVNLMLAGRDTTASGLAWFFWLLSKNPHVEDKILEEIRANSHVCNANNGDSNTNDLNSLVYLHASLCESLRLYPPVPFEHKGVVQPEVLPSGHHVGPKSKIFVSLYSIARMEGVWGKDCKEFKPERWINERGRIRHEPSYKFMSFNSGPRTCLGRDIAFTQMKAVVVNLLNRFEVEIVDGHEVVPKTSIILHMKDGMKVRVKKRPVTIF